MEKPKAKQAIKQAIIVVDMLNDFITGSLACSRAMRIIAPLQKLIAAARQNNVPVIYSNDCHLPGIDHELKLWGNHAIAGTQGAQVIPELAPVIADNSKSGENSGNSESGENSGNGDYIVPKRRYSGFFQTDLHILLKELGVGELIITGMHTHMCVRHTAADGYQWGYSIVAPEDGLEAFTQADHDGGLEYLKTVYGAKITNVDTLIEGF